MLNVLAVDLGGTKLASGIVSEEGDVSEYGVKFVEATRGSRYLTHLLSQEVFSKVQESQASSTSISAVGMGSPGPLDYESGIILEPANLPWRHVPIRQILAELTQLPVFLDNDANCALLGEAWLGAAQGLRDVIMLTLGTGIGGALMQEGDIFHGELGSAELGHRVLFTSEQPCNMGHYGCLESLSSGTAIEREAKVRAKEVFERARAGDGEALAITQRAAAFLARGLSLLDEEYRPQLIVLGGGMSEAKEFRDLIFERIEDDRLRSKVKLTELGEKAGLLGAGRLAFLGIEKR